MRLLRYLFGALFLLSACGTAATNAQPTLPTLPTVTVVGGLVVVPTAEPSPEVITAPEDAAEPTVTAAEDLPSVTPEATAQPAPTQPATATVEPLPVNLDPLEVGSVGADTTLGQHMRTLEEAGLYSGSILVARRGEILLRHGYGMASRTARNTATTRFRLASLTKQFTAAVVLRLHEQGKLSIDDGICAYVELCPDHWRGVTIRMLLAHSSGVPDYMDFLDFDARQATPTTTEELVARFRDVPLKFTPGTAYKYSNSGYILLGQIIEFVTGMPYADVIKNELCIPLGLNDTGYDHSFVGNDPSYAMGLYRVGVPADPIDGSTLNAAGALVSTVDDLYKWDRALHDGQVLKPETLALMRTAQVKNYGLGVMLYPLGGMRTVHHDGMASGIRTFLGTFVDDDITVIVLSNYETADVEGVGTYLAQLARSLP